MLDKTSCGSCESEPLKAATVATLMPIKDQLKTITVDNGKEFAAHLEISDALNVPIYFAYPYHSWERGANENMKGLFANIYLKDRHLSILQKRVCGIYRNN